MISHWGSMPCSERGKDNTGHMECKTERAFSTISRVTLNPGTPGVG
jgi:hypothetical protein